MCRHGEFDRVIIKGEETEIDKCLVPYIKAFQDAGIETLACCCGHGRWDGFIKTKDRLFLVCSEKQSDSRYWSEIDDQARYFDRLRRID